MTASDLRQHILPFFEATRKPTQYLFAGNGMYHAYLMAKVLFRNTPLAKRIHFLPVSGKGRDGCTLDRLGRYFDLIGLDQSAEPIAIVDSFVSGNTLRLSATSLPEVHLSEDSDT